MKWNRVLYDVGKFSFGFYKIVNIFCKSYHMEKLTCESNSMEKTLFLHVLSNWKTYLWVVFDGETFFHVLSNGKSFILTHPYAIFVNTNFLFVRSLASEAMYCKAYVWGLKKKGAVDFLLDWICYDTWFDEYLIWSVIRHKFTHYILPFIMLCHMDICKKNSLAKEGWFIQKIAWMLDLFIDLINYFLNHVTGYNNEELDVQQWSCVFKAWRSVHMVNFLVWDLLEC